MMPTRATPPAPNSRAPGEAPSFYAELSVIALGGAVGASLRHAISLSMAAAQWHFVFATAAANIVGAGLLGLFAGYLSRGGTHPLLRPFLTIGVFGSFTTFSALAMDNRRVALESSEALAALHLGASIVSGLVAFVVADRFASRIHPGGTR